MEGEVVAVFALATAGRSVFSAAIDWELAMDSAFAALRLAALADAERLNSESTLEGPGCS